MPEGGGEIPKSTHTAQRHNGPPTYTRGAASQTTSQQTAHVNRVNLGLVNHHCYSRRVLFQNILNRFSLPLYKVFHER